MHVIAFQIPLLYEASFVKNGIHTHMQVHSLACSADEEKKMKTGYPNCSFMQNFGWLHLATIDPPGPGRIGGH